MGIEYEKGRYLCEVVSQCLTESSKGTPCIEIKFNVVAQQISPNEMEQVNQNVRTWWGYLSDKAIDRTIKDMKSIGILIDSFSDINSPAASIVGNEIVMYCSHEKDDRNNPKEKWGVAFTFTESKPLATDKARQLDAMFGAALKQAKKESASVTAVRTFPKTNSEPPPVRSFEVSDDDVPF